MNCCGQKRHQWQQRMLSDNEPVHTKSEPVPENPVKLKYNGTNTIMVKGKQTGYLYIFGAGEPPFAVDGRDAQDILANSGKFSLTPE
jgi:hypothetical protein